MKDPKIPTVSSPIKNHSNKNKRGSYTNPSDTSKAQKLLKKKHGRHSHDYQRLISGSESGISDDDDDEIKFLDTKQIHKLPKLSGEEEDFFDVVASGNVSAVSEFYDMATSPCDFIKALNFEGYTVLHIAAARQDEEMVDLLCGKYGDCVSSSVLQDVILHAVQEGNVDIVKQLLNVMEARGISIDRTERLKDPLGILAGGLIPVGIIIPESEEFPNSNFTDDITPYILAAQGQSYELMDMFYEIGYRLEPAHKEFCICRDCAKYSEISKAIRRLHQYQALCNPAYICFISLKNSNFDPIFHTFELIQELEECVQTVREFTSEYEELLKDLKQFTFDLLGQCRDIDEVHTFLKRNEGYAGGNEEFPRLSWALKLHQKEFVAHPHCQMVLYEQWIQGWTSWRRTGKIARVFHAISRLFLFPFSAMFCLFSQSGSIGGALASPASRFLNALASYIVFLGLIFIINTSERAEGDRGPPSTGCELPIIIWVVGHLVSIARQWKMEGEAFFSSLWNWYNIFTQFMFIGAFICWIIAWVELTEHKHIPRKYWPVYEPILIGEVFFALASVMAYSRLVRWLQLEFRIGPLITAMGQMGRDILDVLIFISIIISSFSGGLYYMYRTYHGWADKDDDGKATAQHEEFTTFIKTLETLFFALFAMSDAQSPTIIERKIVDPFNSSVTSTNHHYVTQTTGRIIYAAFHLIATMMAMNLVGGLVISSYERIQENVDIEWKFVRGQIWISFVRDTVNPSPFNLLPTIPGCMAAIGSKNKAKAHPDTENPKKSRRKLDNAGLTRQLVERYIRDKAEIAETERANTEIVTSLREDLSELREAMDKSERILNKRIETGVFNVKNLVEQNFVPEQHSQSHVPLQPTVVTQSSLNSIKSVVPSVVFDPSKTPSRPDTLSQPADVKNIKVTHSDNRLSPQKRSSPTGKPPLLPPTSLGTPPPSQISLGKPAPSQISLGKPVPSQISLGKPLVPTITPPGKPLPPLPALPESSLSSSSTIKPMSTIQQVDQGQTSAAYLSSDPSLPATRRRSSDLSKNVRFHQPPNGQPPPAGK